MKSCIAILLCSSLALAQNVPKQRPAQPSKLLPQVLASVLPEVKAKSHVPLLLPNELPQLIEGAKYAVVQTASEDEYRISLYYELDIGNAGFAASFGVKANPKYGPKDLPNVREGELSKGEVGYFRPVSCGGSCAPANIWWAEGRILYNVQLKLSPSLPESDQQKAMTAVANSAILAGAR